MKKIGEYLLQERLGRGNMSEVWKARHQTSERLVALKVLQPRDEIFVDLLGEDGLREFFFEEARLLKEFRREHVAELIDCGEENGIAYIVLAYYPDSLGSLIGDSTRVEVSATIAVEAACRYLHQTLCGLEELHGAGVIHRDIKPDNLMITDDDLIRIIDFGLCTIRGKKKMTIPGMQVGSPFYAAPEQEDDPEKTDERADLFSVGVVAYRLLTGRLVNHRQKSIPPPSRYTAGLNQKWDEFLLKGICKERRGRYQTARKMRLQLESVCRSCSFRGTEPA